MCLLGLDRKGERETMMRREDYALRVIGQVLDEALEEAYGRKMGFSLVVFPFGYGPRVADYVSNGERNDVIAVLREKADALEAGSCMPPAIGRA